MILLSYFHSFLFLNRRFLFRKDKSYLERKKSCRVAFLVEQGNHIRVEEGEEEADLATPSWTKNDAVQPLSDLPIGLGFLHQVGYGVHKPNP